MEGFAAVPGISGDVSVVAASGGLEPVIRRHTSGDFSGWLGWEVPAARPGGQICCCDFEEARRVGPCDLDDHGSWNMRRGDGDTPSRVRVFARFEKGSLTDVRTFSAGCFVEPGGRPLIWLSDVSPEQSTNWLADQVNSAGGSHLGSSALAAFALHGIPSVAPRLESFAAGRNPMNVRKSAVFWLGEAWGERELGYLVRLAGDAGEPVELRKDAVFAIHLSKAGGSTDELIRIARRDPTPEMRKTALFWLGQRAGARAVETLEEAVSGDPEAEVRKAAVFGLSQLPHEQGIPVLSKLALTHPDRGVRKQAIFWLSQMDDPRALEVIAEILDR